MSPLIRSMPLCAGLLLAALPAVADQPAAPPAPAAAVQTTPAQIAPVAPVTQGTAPADHDAYTRHAEGDMREWETKLHAFADKAKVSGQAASSASDEALHRAWAKVQVAWHGLESAGSESWDGARHAYETASTDFASAWQSAQRHL